MALIYLSGAWVAGIYLGSRFALPPALILIGLVPLTLLFFFRKKLKAIILTAVCLTAFLGGALCYQASLPPDDASHLRFYNGQEVEIKGMVSADPEIKDKSTHIRLSASQMNGEDVSGDALLFVPRYPEYDYGDVLQVKGKLETPAQLGDFDYKGYLENQGIYATMLYPDIEVLETGEGLAPLEWVYSLKNSLSRSIAQTMPEPAASLAQGVVLGIRYNIPQSIKDDFARTGTAHLLAISGLHLSILAGILLSIGIRLFGKKRYIYIWLALGVIWLYALITGLNPPVVRGAIMASLFLGAELLGRQRTAITSLAFAAAVMVGIDPPILRGAAFQLSFLGMAGLIFIAPPLMSLGRKLVAGTIGEEGAGASIATIVTDSFSVTLAAIIAVWPVVAHYFGIVSLVGPLATFLALPALPAIIVLGTAGGIIGLVFLPVAQGIGWLAWLFASYMLLIVKGLAALPVSAVEVDWVSTPLMVTYYAIIAIVIWLVSSRKRLPQVASWLKDGASRSTGLVSRLPLRWVVPPLLILAVLATAAATTMPDDRLRVSFLDIGQGEAILIQKGSQQVLVDGGPSPQALNLELGGRMPFWDRTIELVVLSHPHADHLSGLVEIMQRYKVEQVLYPDLNDESPLCREWLGLIEERDIKCTIARAGQEINLGDGVTMKVLNPPASPLTGTGSDINNNSVVLYLSAGEVSFLLTGDIEREAEFGLIARGNDLSGTVLKVGHSGSKTSTTPDFLAAVSPGVAVISVGENSYGHPSGDVMERLEAELGKDYIYRTDEQGTIEFITDGERLWVEVNNSS
ncbi:MAG: ComEC/Rec2 family competence protein [Deltaproteobacteria bacterium]|nr:ComEC/Rec2 family competence protein [Deltaproteobacteria bacterium]